jgi:hypothetical protein
MDTDGTCEPRLAPIACTLDNVAYRDRVAAWEALSKRARLSGLRTGAGVELRYRRDPEVEQALRELIELERLCCPFLEFQLERDRDEIVLRIVAPGEALPVLDEFLRVDGPPHVA